MKTIRFQSTLLVLLALIFTAGLMFASVEVPLALDRLLHSQVDFLDVATGQNALSDYKTELFLSRYHIRLLGYISLGLIVLLIAAGFLLEKHTLVSAGAIALFLPAFGHFAATMFFLGGLGFLRVLWLPFLDVSFDVIRLGDIILLPYDWALEGFRLLGINLYRELPFIITGTGIFIFLLGVIAWMQGRIRNRDVTDFRIYRISRHPQYLGWIIWSYGVLFLPGPNLRQYMSVGNTLPWLLATIIIIGVAMLEERSMVRKCGAVYEQYRQNTPFLIPLPQFLRTLFSLPQQLLFKKPYPERKREIAALLAFYTVLCIFLSALATGMVRLPGPSRISALKIERLTHTISTSSHRGDIRHAAASLAEMGGTGVDSLISLLGHENLFVRCYSANALGDVQSDKTVKPLSALLRDPDPNVRRAATGALGGTGSAEAIPVLIQILRDSESGEAIAAARGVGRLRAAEAIPLLIQRLDSDNAATARAAAWALGEIGSKEAIPALIASLERDASWHFYIVGEALHKLGSPAAEDAFILGLQQGDWRMQSGCVAALGKSGTETAFRALAEALQKDDVRVRRAAVLALPNYPSEQSASLLKQALNDPDWEVRMYATEALK